MTRDKIPIYLTIHDLSERLNQPTSLFRQIIAANRQPADWIWRKNWDSPRFPESSFGAWARTVHEVDHAALPEDPVRLEHPGRVFARPGPSKAELEIAGRILDLGACNE